MVAAGKPSEFAEYFGKRSSLPRGPCSFRALSLLESFHLAFVMLLQQKVCTFTPRKVTDPSITLRASQRPFPQKRQRQLLLYVCKMLLLFSKCPSTSIRCSQVDKKFALVWMTKATNRVSDAVSKITGGSFKEYGVPSTNTLRPPSHAGPFYA